MHLIKGVADGACSRSSVLPGCGFAFSAELFVEVDHFRNRFWVVKLDEILTKAAVKLGGHERADLAGFLLGGYRFFRFTKAFLAL